MKRRDLLEFASSFVEKRSVLVTLAIMTAIWILAEALGSALDAGPSEAEVRAHEDKVAAELGAGLPQGGGAAQDALIRLLARQETQRAIERGEVARSGLGRVAAFVRKAAVPGSLLLLLSWMLVLARFDSTAEKLTTQLGQLVQTETEFFSDVDVFFGDLLKRGVQNPNIRQILATRLRIESDRNFAQHPNVAKYYTSVIERCVRDARFRLVRVMASDQPAALMPLCEQWFSAVGEFAHRVELRLLHESLSHTLINLAVLLSDHGAEHVYIIVSPNDTEIKALRISRDRQLLHSFRQYHERLTSGDWSTRLTPENYRGILTSAPKGKPSRPAKT